MGAMNIVIDEGDLDTVMHLPNDRRKSLRFLTASDCRDIARHSTHRVDQDIHDEMANRLNGFENFEAAYRAGMFEKSPPEPPERVRLLEVDSEVGDGITVYITTFSSGDEANRDLIAVESTANANLVIGLTSGQARAFAKALTDEALRLDNSHLNGGPAR